MTINEKSNKLMQLITPHRAGNTMQRIQAFVVNKTGKKLTEYLSNGASEGDKSNLLDELITIVEEQWDRLPSAAQGQQTTAATAPVSKPAAPKAIAPTPPTPPAPKPTPAAAPKPAAPAPVAPPPPAEVTDEPLSEQPAPVDPITAALAALQAAVEAKRAPAPATLSLSVDEVRIIARKEIASVFRTIAEVLEAQAK